MSCRFTFRLTRRACYLGYVTQAITINFLPLLFLTFEKDFGLSLAKISLLIGINFSIQLGMDLLSVWLIDRVHQRGAVLCAHLFASLGLVLLGTLPYLLPDPFVGILISVCFMAIGGGLIEVLISPLAAACSDEKKAGSMSLLHSFYCWGQAGVILFSVLFFGFFGTGNWRYLSFAFALLPALNVFLFSVAPLVRFGGENGGTPARGLLRRPVFLLLLLMMLTAGACEMIMSQWASSFAEMGLRVEKSLGDLLGPCLFALLMGAARLLYAKLADRVPLLLFMAGGGILCAVSYLLAALSPLPLLSLFGCALCGFAVGIFWPGTLSIAARFCPQGGGAMFAMLALAGDVGCVLGPSIAGGIADRMGQDLRLPFLLATALPLLFVLAALVVIRLQKGRDTV